MSVLDNVGQWEHLNFFKLLLNLATLVHYLG